MEVSFTHDGRVFELAPELRRLACTGCAFEGHRDCMLAARATDQALCAGTIFVEKKQPIDEAAVATPCPKDGTEKPMRLPADPDERKAMPITTGVLDYFPLAMAEVAKVSRAGNDQHNPGQPLHWDRTKSLDHADCIARHLIDRGTRDTDGQRHSAKLAWRALANLETELEAEQGAAS